MKKHKAKGGGVGEPEVPKSGKTAKPKDHAMDLDAKDSPEAKEIHNEKEEFHKGGSTKKKMKDGGHAEGKKPHHRPDRKHRASGGGARSPYTEAHMLKGPSSSKTGEGHEDDGDAKSEISD